MRTIPEIPVSEIPFFEGEISSDEKARYGMILPGGKINYYRLMFAKGQGGSKREDTWNKKEHTCCHSKVCWRHKVGCPGLDNPQELS